MWDASKGLIKKIALKDGIFIIDINQHDLKKIYDCKCNVYSLILDKYTSLQTKRGSDYRDRDTNLTTV